MNPYKILGITSSATKSQLRAAYFQKAKELHPDSPTGSPQKFKELHEAYQYLNTYRNIHASPSYEPGINFSSLIKNYRRAGKSTSEKSRKDEPAIKENNSGASFSILMQSLFFISIFSFLYMLDSSDSHLESFELTYKKSCNQVEYPSSCPFKGEKWFEIKY